MVAAHGNSLRSIIMYLERLTSQEVASCSSYECIHLIYVKFSLVSNNRNMIELYLSVNKQVISLELSTGVPLLYIYTEGKYTSRGSPVGPTEDGVYAYTQV